MSPRIATTMAFCLLAAATPPRAAGFAPAASVAPAAPRLAPLAMSSSHSSEDAYPQLLSGASLCADSESCSVESAQLYLREIVHVQSGCAAGTLLGDAVCGDVQGVSEVVANLRRKIKEGAKEEVRTFWGQRQEELEILAAASDGSSALTLTAPLKPAYLAIAALYTLAFIATVQPAIVTESGVAPFSPQEVWWAVQGGYLGDMAHHLFHNGGLLVADATPTVGLAPQELWWSVRDGYAGDTLFAGGDAVGGAEFLPFTPQEVWWSVRQGYAGDLAQHWFRNGGL